MVVPVLACRRRDQANPVSYLNAEVRSGSDISVCREVIDATLPGKASKLQLIENRTVNRHR
jgi:hypothetical protein